MPETLRAHYVTTATNHTTGEVRQVACMRCDERIDVDRDTIFQRYAEHGAACPKAGR